MIRNRLKLVGAGVGTLAMICSLSLAAGADTIYNTLDGSIDAVHESMTVSVGTSGSTTLKIDAPKANQQLPGDTDHPGCNIPGNHSLLMTANFDSTYVNVSFLNGDNAFNSCDEVLTVTVTGVAATAPATPTTVTFSGTPSDPNDPHIGYSYAESTFDVTVLDSVTPPPPVVCDADPAAPAWANAILKANNVKNKTTVQNTISSVAHHMTQGAMFDGIAKNIHPDYENAVYNYLKDTLHIALPLADAAHSARPGWECSTQSA
jgi:hypothetical protein